MWTISYFKFNVPVGVGNFKSGVGTNANAKQDLPVSTCSKSKVDWNSTEQLPDLRAYMREHII